MNQNLTNENPSSSVKPPHFTLTRTVFISRIFSFISKSYLIPRLALTTTSWDDCAWIDCGIEDYLPPRFGLQRYQSNRDGKVFPSEVLRALSRALRYCFTFCTDELQGKSHNEEENKINSANSMRHHQQQRNDGDEDFVEENDNQRIDISVSSSSSKGQRSNRRGGGGGGKRGGGRNAASNQRLLSDNDDYAQRNNHHQNDVSENRDDDDHFHQQPHRNNENETESENAQLFVLTRRLRVALLHFFGATIESVSGMNDDKNEESVFLHIFLDDNAPNQTRLICADSKYYIFGSGKSLRIFHKKKDLMSTNDINNNKNLLVLPRDEVSHFLTAYDSSEIGNFRLYPRPQPDFNLFSSSMNASTSISSSKRNATSSVSSSLSSSSFQRTKLAHELVIAAPDEYLDAFGILALDSKTAGNLYNRFHLFGELDARLSISRADKHFAQEQGFSQPHVHRFYQCVAWSPDGNFLLAPGPNGLLVYDFKNEYRRQSFRRHPGTTSSSMSSQQKNSRSNNNKNEGLYSLSQPINTFFVDFGHHTSFNSENEINFIASTFNDHGYAVDDYASYTTTTNKTNTNKSAAKREEWFIAVGRSSADETTSDIYFFDLSNLDQNYEENFERLKQSSISNSSSGNSSSWNSSSNRGSRNGISLHQCDLAKFVPPPNSFVKIDGYKPEGRSARINHFITGCFCPSSRSSSISSTQRLIDGNFERGYFRHFPKDVTPEWLHTKVQTTHSSKIFIAVSENDSTNSHYIAGYTLDGFCLWGPQHLLSTDSHMGLIITKAEQDFKKIFSESEKFHKVIITKDDSNSSNNSSSSSSAATTTTMAKEEDENFVICVAGDKGTILILTKSISYHSEPNFVAYYSSNPSSPSAIVSTVNSDYYRDTSSGKWLSVIQSSHSLSHQHIVHPDYTKHGVRDIVFVPKHPLFRHCYHRKAGTLLVSCPVNSNNTIFHIWRLKPNNINNYNNNHTFFDLVQTIDVASSFDCGTGFEALEIVSLACIPGRLRITASSSPTSPTATKTKKSENKNRRTTNNDDGDETNDDENEQQNEDDQDANQDESVKNCYICETTLIISLKSDLNELKFFYYSIIETMDPSVVLTQKTKNEGDVETDRIKTDHPLVRVCIVRKNDAFNEMNGEDYIETEDMFGEIQRHKC